MTYPRHPAEILKEIRNEQGLSATQMGQRLERAAKWPRSRWDNLEKGGQGLETGYVLDLVQAGVLQNTDPRFAELQDWEDYQERVKDQSYQTINERFETREDFRHWVRTGRVPVDPLVTPLDPPPEPREADVGREEEELPSAFPDKAPEEKPEPPPTAKPDRTKTTISEATLKKALYVVGILACFMVIVWFGNLMLSSRTAQVTSPTAIPQMRVVEVVVTATPPGEAVSQSTASGITNTPESQPAGNRMIRINLHQDLPDAYREIVFSNTSSLWMTDGATLTGKNNPWAETLGVWGPGMHYLPEADPASDAIGYVEVDCPAGLSDKEVVAKLWENNPQEDDRLGYGWEFRIFADGSYEFIAP